MWMKVFDDATVDCGDPTKLGDDDRVRGGSRQSEDSFVRYLGGRGNWSMCEVK